MKKILLGILMVLVSGYAFAGPIVLFGSDNREKGTVDNPLYVTGGSGGIENNTITGDFTVTGSMSIGGDATITGTLQASAANILGVDEVMSFSDGNSIDGNKTPGYITIDDLMVTSSDTTLGNAFRVQDSALSTKFTVLSNGNVGIGSTAPNATLKVVGTIIGTSTGYFTSDVTAGGTNIAFSGVKGTAANDFNIGGNNRNVITIDAALYGVGFSGTGTTIGSANAAIDVGGFTRTYLPAMAIGSTSIGVAGSVEVDGSIYAGSYYSSDGTVGATVTTCTSFKNGLCVGGS